MFESLKGKHLLVDTNVLSNIFNKPEDYSPLMNALQNLGVVLCINPYIHIELIRIARNPEQHAAVQSFFDKQFWELPATPDILNSVKEFYPFYNHCNLVRNKNQISVVDAINVAYLRKYRTLHLITSDHSDFPLEILERNEVGAIDLKNDIATWGTYSFNQKKFENLATSFNKKI